MQGYPGAHSKGVSPASRSKMPSHHEGQGKATQRECRSDVLISPGAVPEHCCFRATRPLTLNRKPQRSIMLAWSWFMYDPSALQGNPSPRGAISVLVAWHVFFRARIAGLHGESLQPVATASAGASAAASATASVNFTWHHSYHEATGMNNRLR